MLAKRIIPCLAKEEAIFPGLSEYTVLAWACPWTNLTHCPSFRSMAGKIIICNYTSLLS